MFSQVASRADAWIETPKNKKGEVKQIVASRADAWIETFRSIFQVSS